jgi:hypothetical protein
MARRAGRPGASKGGIGPIGALADANAWAVIPAESNGMPAGARIEVRLLSDVAEGP